MFSPMTLRIPALRALARSGPALAALVWLGCAPAVQTAPAGSEAAGGERSEDASETEEATMMVIRVLVRVQEGRAEDFLAHMAQETPRVLEFEGCERYAVFADPSEANRFLLYEEWASAEAFEAYRSSELLAESFRVLGPMMAGPPDSSYFSANPVGP